IIQQNIKYGTMDQYRIICMAKSIVFVHGTHMVFVIVDDVDAMDQVLQVNVGHNHNAFPFDLNFDADEEDLQYHPDMQEYGVYAGDVEVVFEQEELDDSDDEGEHQNKNLTKIQRQQIYAALAGKTNNGILRKKCYNLSCSNV
uniref:DUF7769 domain-containing protein n=1 Tax=Oryza glaberrima TaxID=4538 RepID=I1QYW8_ORYGL